MGAHPRTEKALSEKLVGNPLLFSFLIFCVNNRHIKAALVGGRFWASGEEFKARWPRGEMVGPGRERGFIVRLKIGSDLGVRSQAMGVDHGEGPLLRSTEFGIFKGEVAGVIGTSASSRHCSRPMP